MATGRPLDQWTVIELRTALVERHLPEKVRRDRLPRGTVFGLGRA